MTLGVYTSRSFIDRSLFQHGMIRSCKISTDTRVCNSRASYKTNKLTYCVVVLVVVVIWAVGLNGKYNIAVQC